MHLQRHQERFAEPLLFRFVIPIRPLLPSTWCCLRFQSLLPICCSDNRCWCCR
eukprot:jgi/Psemu1/303174/fgenesh1_kg.95_\